MYWAGVVEPLESEPGYDRPYLIVQNNTFNGSRINTVVVCGLTSNLRRAGEPGNVLPSPGEADLSEQSVVNVSRTVTLDKGQLRSRIGALSRERVREVSSGINLVMEPREADR